MIAIVLSVFTHYMAIGLLRDFIQPIRLDGPKSHLKKKGVPTLGGITILGLVIIQLMWLGLLTHPIGIVYIGFALIGLYDDVLKVKFTHSRGLSARYKFMLQWLIALLALNGLPSTVFFFGYAYEIGILHKVYGGLIIVGASNAYNLTDGVDGLAASQALILLFFLGMVAVSVNHYALINISTILWVSIFGFFVFNIYPAKIIMGDVGSLPIGASLGLMSILLGIEWFFAIAALVLVIETLSVMIQVFSYKLGYGRVFKMAPIHHHLELSGWSEKQIVAAAAMFTIVICWMVLWCLI